jgi:hypothetical protein
MNRLMKFTTTIAKFKVNCVYGSQLSRDRQRSGEDSCRTDDRACSFDWCLVVDVDLFWEKILLTDGCSLVD